MCQMLVLVNFLLVLWVQLCGGQVLQFGGCAEVEPMQYFDLERFLGEWYEIERFPTWYEQFGFCNYKRFQYCSNSIEIEHIYVRDGIQFILHMNSSFTPGDKAIFAIKESNIDPVGIPLTVISTDYNNYAIIYGCKNNHEMDIKYIIAWILSRTPSLQEDILKKAHLELNTIPFANVAYLETVDHTKQKCNYYWTAHVQANNITDAIRSQMLFDDGIFDFIN